MPIRFRCVYCDKLLGIARRKAGAVVNCPQCGQPLIVPTPEPEPTAAAGSPPAPGRLFERDDFEAMLQGDATVRTPDGAAQRRPKASRRATPDPLPPRPFPVERSLPSPPQETTPTYEPPASRAPAAGIVLTPGLLIVLIVAAFLLIGGAFGGGILVGRMLN